MTSVELSIIVPTFNEAGNVTLLYDRLNAALSDYRWEVLFVDDASSDGTAQEAFLLSHKDERVRLITRVADRGLAKSCIQGLLSAKGTLLVVMDADGQHDPAVIVDMLTRQKEDDLDIVSAARRLDETTSDGSLSARRQTLSRVANALSSQVIGRSLIDPMTGFFLIKRDAFLEIAPKLQDAGFKILLDILHSNKSLTHDEVLFRFGQREHGTSKLGALVMWQFFTFLVSRATGKVLPSSLISFVLVGGFGLAVHLFALYASLAFGTGFAVAQFIATVVAATSNFLLNNVLTFPDKQLRGRGLLSGYFKFLIVASIGILANVSVAVYAYEALTNFVVLAALAGVMIDTIWKFAVSRRFIWK